MNQQGTSETNATPGQGNRPQGMGKGNMTECGNHTQFVPGNGNITPPDKPDWDPSNMTAMNNTAWGMVMVQEI
jgi:hypothetical protein